MKNQNVSKHFAYKIKKLKKKTKFRSFTFEISSVSHPGIVDLQKEEIRNVKQCSDKIKKIFGTLTNVPIIN